MDCLAVWLNFQQGNTIVLPSNSKTNCFVLPFANELHCQDNSLSYRKLMDVCKTKQIVLTEKFMWLPRQFQSQDNLNCPAEWMLCLTLPELSCPLYKLSFWLVLGLLGNLTLSSLVFVLSFLCLTSTKLCLYIWLSFFIWKCSSLCNSKHL